MLEHHLETTMQTEKLYKVAIITCAVAGGLRLLLSFVHFGDAEPTDRTFDFTVAGICFGLAFLFNHFRQSSRRR
jgi:hypothetical protein